LISYIWGWAADRYGGKPVLLFGLTASLLVPFCLTLTPRHSPWSFLIAAAIMFGASLCSIGYGTASQHLMYVNLVPPDKKTRYMALHYAWMGIVAG